MDYSKFISSVIHGDQAETTRLCNKMVPVLKNYLMFNAGATEHDAEDAIQMAFEYIIGRIREGKEFHNPESLMSYMLIASRHNYYTVYRSRKNEELDEMVGEPASKANQLDHLLNQEMQVALEGCVQSLKPKQQVFIRFWFDNLGVPARTIAENFGISEEAVWTKKHRILGRIHECVKRKLGR